MKLIFFILLLLEFLYLFIPLNCELTRHSADVLRRDRIYIEGHRGVSAGQKNHNTKEAILESINKGVESVEIDVWLTTDKKLVVIHDFQGGIYECEKVLEIPIPKYNIGSLSWEKLKTCVTKEGNNSVPLLEEIFEITKDKIFLNLEIKDDNLEIWDYIQDLIEKYEYYDQISICGFNHAYYEKVEKYNKDFNRTIVFGNLDLHVFVDKNKPNHQISINALSLKGAPKIVEEAHNNNMSVAVYFFNEPRLLYEIFEYGIDVVITDYPLRAAEQLKKYYSGENYLEGCKSVGKNFYDKLSCTECENGYELIYIIDKDRNICKLKYELNSDLYIKDDSGIYHEKNIFAIKMLFSPIKNEAICYKNGKKIFYFEWLFDLIGYDYDYYKFVNFSENYHPYPKNFILNKEKAKNSTTYSLLTKEHIKKLNFDELEIYVGNNIKISQKDFLCKDLYSTSYYTTYTVMGLHCYFQYNGTEEITYASFNLFDKQYISYVTYDDKYLINSGSWRPTASIYFSKSNSICDKIEDPFEACIKKINNCLICENENICKRCIEDYSLVNGQCFSSINYENNPKYFTPDDGISYLTCSSVIDYCEECYYDIFSVNNFHCTKCSDGINLEESHLCDINQHVIPFTNTLSGKIIGSSCYNENNILNCNLHKIELPNFSCWKFKDNSNNQEHCIIYPNDESTQKEYYKLYLGTAKEDFITKSKNENDIMIPEKETYKKDETVIFKRLKDILTNEDKSIINRSNTCYSQFYKGYSNFLKNGVFSKIENKNLCYNADIFPENNGILNCGFANISLFYGEKKYNIQTCYFMPDNEISKIMSDFIRRSLIEEMWGKEGTFGKILKQKNKHLFLDNNIRSLQENELSFEIIIENKKGKIIKYDSNSYNITIVKDEKEDNDNNNSDENDDDSDIEIIKPAKSNEIKFNWLLAIYIILSLF